MKKTTFFLGYLFALIFVFGATFRLMHWPYSETLMLAGVTGLTIFFLPLFLFNQEEAKVTTAIKWILVASCYSLIFWFEFMKWPGAGELLLLGALGLAFVLMPYFFIRLYKKSTW